MVEGAPLARQAAERRLLYGVSLALDRLIDAVSEHEHEGPCELMRVFTPGTRPRCTSRGSRSARPLRLMVRGSRSAPTEEEEVRVGEVRVTIVEPSAEQRALKVKIPTAKLQAMRRAERRANSVESQANSVESQEPERRKSLVIRSGS